jgi:hypothetical protein
MSFDHSIDDKLVKRHISRITVIPNDSFYRNVRLRFAPHTESLKLRTDEGSYSRQKRTSQRTL